MGGVRTISGQAFAGPSASMSAMKARQCAKISELRQRLVQAGYDSLGTQAVALGLSRSTTWALLQANHKSSGLSGAVIKRMSRARAEQELSETTERGPPLQPDQPIGEVKRAQERRR
jgi:hypothetical protein